MSFAFQIMAVLSNDVYKRPHPALLRSVPLKLVVSATPCIGASAKQLMVKDTGVPMAEMQVETSTTVAEALGHRVSIVELKNPTVNSTRRAALIYSVESKAGGFIHDMVVSDVFDFPCARFTVCPPNLPVSTDTWVSDGKYRMQMRNILPFKGLGFGSLDIAVAVRQKICCMPYCDKIAQFNDIACEGCIMAL